MADPTVQPIAVTGATGALGSRVARGLADRGVPVRLVVRDPGRAPELPGAEVAVAAGYHDRPSLTEALRGTSTLFLVSGRESADRVAEHKSAVDAAVDAGVERIVYTSFLGAAPDATVTFARDHHATEEHIRATSLAHTFLRNSMYAEYVPLSATEEGVIKAPAGDGRLAWVARDDAADAAVAVLTGDCHGGVTYELTGPDAHSFGWAAEQLSAAAGRPVTYVDETLEEAYASRASYGAPGFEVDGWVTSYLAVARGELEVVSTTVEDLTGHPPQSFPAFLAAHPESCAHLRAG
jgi:NAD(P)H dehydrogenase (quinone)